MKTEFGIFQTFFYFNLLKIFEVFHFLFPRLIAFVLFDKSIIILPISRYSIFLSVSTNSQIMLFKCFRKHWPDIKREAASVETWSPSSQNGPGGQCLAISGERACPQKIKVASMRRSYSIFSHVIKKFNSETYQIVSKARTS